MQIRTARKSLLTALTKVGSVVERRQTLPVLGNLHLEAAGQHLVVTGSDRELEIRARLAARIDQPGAITVPARKFIDIARSLPEDAEITLKVQNERAILSAGRSRFTLATLPADDYPLMASTVDAPAAHTLPQLEIKQLLDLTAFAMANQDVRYFLNGLLWEVSATQVTTVASDGHRLARLQHAVTLPAGEPWRIIMPRKTVLELGRLLDPDGPDVPFAVTDRTLHALIGDTALTSKLVDGIYPQYERVIPAGVTKHATVEREPFRQALHRAAILSADKFKSVRLTLTPGELCLQAQNPEHEEAEDVIALDYDGEPLTIGFNIAYLQDILATISEEQVELRLQDAGSSGLLRGLGRDDQTYVVMPILL